MRRILAENQKSIMDQLDKVFDKKRDFIKSSFQDWRNEISKVICKLETITMEDMVIIVHFDSLSSIGLSSSG